MKRSVTLVALALVASGCATGAGSGAQTRTVLMDFSHDEFSSFFLSYFPRRIQAHPGDTVVFKQTWTGEPHSVTMGTLVNKLGDVMRPYLEIFEEKGWEGLPEEEPKEVAEASEGLPWMFADEDEVAQNGAQPCFLKTGLPPKDPKVPCTAEQRKQPAFDGTHSYYNSGFVPYEGPSGNTFSVKLASDAKPGTYFYYCNLHGPLMSGDLVVEPTSKAIPSQDEVNRLARRKIQKEAKPMAEAVERARAGRYAVPDEPPSGKALLEKMGMIRKQGGRTFFKGNFAGLNPEEAQVHGGINEFIPRTIRAKAGQKISWAILGSHSISFNVPEYFPIIEVAKDGTVKRNPKLDPPAGGAPASEPPDGGDGAGPSEPPVVDAGTWDGKGFWSTGVVGAEPFLVYSLAISTPGTYKYACLIHPPMVGTVVVSSA